MQGVLSVWGTISNPIFKISSKRFGFCLSLLLKAPPPTPWLSYLLKFFLEPHTALMGSARQQPQEPAHCSSRYGYWKHLVKTLGEDLLGNMFACTGRKHVSSEGHFSRYTHLDWGQLLYIRYTCVLTFRWPCPASKCFNSLWGPMHSCLCSVPNTLPQHLHLNGCSAAPPPPTPVFQHSLHRAQNLPNRPVELPK